jgi:hypothetical protein
LGAQAFLALVPVLAHGVVTAAVPVALETEALQPPFISAVDRGGVLATLFTACKAACLLQEGVILLTTACSGVELIAVFAVTVVATMRVDTQLVAAVRALQALVDVSAVMFVVFQAQTGSAATFITAVRIGAGPLARVVSRLALVVVNADSRTWLALKSCRAAPTRVTNTRVCLRHLDTGFYVRAGLVLLARVGSAAVSFAFAVVADVRGFTRTPDAVEGPGI